MIKQHKNKIINAKKSKGGKVQICIVDKNTIGLLLKHDISINYFLCILKQYIILLVQPNLNKLLVVREKDVVLKLCNYAP